MKRPSYVGSVAEDRPRTIYFYATSHCNSNCSYCIFRKSNKDLFRLHMPYRTIERVWTNSEILMNCGIVVQGGEFTIHPEAEDIMHFFYHSLPKVTLLTNAVDPELAKPLVQYSHQVTISLDGPNHDVARGVKGNLDSVFDLLSYLHRIDKNTTLQITLGPWNAPNVVKATDNVMWFIDTCMIYGCQPRFNIASDDGLLGIANYDQKVDILNEVAIGLNSISNHSQYDTIAKSLKSGARYITAATQKMSGSKRPCFSTSIYSTIGADGQVWLCQGLSEHEATIGNVFGEFTFDQIWASAAQKRKEYRFCQACSLSCQLNGDIAYESSMF